MAKRRKPKKRRAPNLPPGVATEAERVFQAGLAYHQRGDLQQAEAHYKHALSVFPEHAHALHNLGVLANQVGQFAAAVEIIDAAIRSEGDIPLFHFNKGVALQELDRPAEAEKAYRRAISLDAKYLVAWENLGVSLQNQGNFDAAMGVYEHTQTLDPTSPVAYLNLGTLLMNSGRPADARAQFRTLLELSPAYGEAHLKYASTCLALGDFEEGWAHYEWRFHAESYREQNPARVVPYPHWDGSSLHDRTLLVTAEQGIGDELMFAACFADVIAKAKHCIIECDPRLKPLYERSFPEAGFVDRASAADFAWDAGLPPVDCRIDAGSLPRHLRSAPEHFPEPKPYLRADDTRVAHWRDRLAGLTAGDSDRPTIGISWQGGIDSRARSARSIPLEAWSELIGSTNANFVNLQYGDHSAEIERFNANATNRVTSLDEIDPLTDMDEFAALVGALDHVLSIDNSTVFVAGAIGTPVTVMLPGSGEWRWMTDSATSPWCPGATLLRKAYRDSWDGVLQQAAAELREVRA